MLTYLTTADVVGLGGRASNRFAALGGGGQKIRLEAATSRIDDICGQRKPAGGSSGALIQQSGAVYVKRVTRSGNILFIPNRPITSVSAISVEPGGYSPYPLPIDTPEQTVFIRGHTIEYRWAGGTATVPVGLDEIWDRPFSEGDTVTVTYTCGYPYWVSAGLGSTLGLSLTAGAISATLVSAANFVDGDLVRIGSDYVQLQAPAPGHPNYGQPAVDYAHNVIWFPYSPTTVSALSGAAVTKGSSGVPAMLKLATLKLMAREYFMDLDNPTGALEVRRSGDMQVFGRGLIADMQGIEVEQMLSDWKIEVWV